MPRGIINHRKGYVRLSGDTPIVLDPGKNRVSDEQYDQLTENRAIRRLLDLGVLEDVPLNGKSEEPRKAKEDELQRAHHELEQQRKERTQLESKLRKAEEDRELLQMELEEAKKAKDEPTKPEAEKPDQAKPKPETKGNKAK